MVNAIKKNYVAVVTGAGAGIGAAAAKYFSNAGMKLILLDTNLEALKKVEKDLSTEYRLIEGSVTDKNILQKIHDVTYETFGQVNILFNNAGISLPTSPWTEQNNWKAMMEVNFFSVLEIQSLFVPSMLKQNTPAAIVNLGSKEGITTPPGNAGYSVSKAGIKVLTEQLAYELRELPNHQVTAHLLVPGYTWTPMNFPYADFTKLDTKPPEPWSTEELMIFFERSLLKDDFYMIAPDNEVTSDIDKRRMEWSMGDIINNRPALSRWHKKYRREFDKFLNQQ